MRIGVNVRFLLKDRLEGIGWFTHEIFKRIVQNHPEHQFYFYFDRPWDPSFIFADNVVPVNVPPQARASILWTTWFNISIPYFLKKHKIDLFISTDGFCSLKTKVPQLHTIHDLAFEHFPEHLPKKFLNYYLENAPRYARKADHIICVSEFTKQDVVKQYKIQAENISVVYNGAHTNYKVLPKEVITQVRKTYSDGKPYFVFAGALHPRKNIVRLLKAFELFKEQNHCDMQLLLIGRLAWKSEKIKTALKDHPFRSDIKHYAYMGAQELSQIIGSAFAVSFVSLFEGFGIPILEGMKCGIPCIVSKTSSMPEVGGEAVLYIDPEQTEEITHQMSRLYQNADLYQSLKEKSLKQAEQFSWDQSAEQMWAVIEKKFT